MDLRLSDRLFRISPNVTACGIQNEERRLEK